MDRGSSHHISHKHVSVYRDLLFDTVRSFPEGTRNCYTLRPAQGKGRRYLIRATFMYGDYDGKSILPAFDLYVGEDYWITINIARIASSYYTEIIHTSSSDYIHVCLVKTGEDTPFISALELRLLDDSMYRLPDKSMILKYRDNLVNDSLDIRYEDDLYDRIWESLDIVRPPSVGRYVGKTTLAVDATNETFTHPPPTVLASCEGPTNLSTSPNMTYSWNQTLNINRKHAFYLFMYFAELEELKANEFREFNIYVNGRLFYGPFAPQYLKAKVIFNEIPFQILPQNNFSLIATNKSTLPPMISAVEVYLPMQISDNATEDNDVAAIRDLKTIYRLTKNWIGDPCMPETSLWDGLNCSYDASNPARIISLNLSSSELHGTISLSISNLTALQKLDLSNNNLTGQVPEFLAELPSLEILNLKGNLFAGPYPTRLLQKSNNGTLTLSIDEPTVVNLPAPTNTAEKTRALTIIASVSVAVLIAFCADL